MTPDLVSTLWSHIAGQVAVLSDIVVVVGMSSPFMWFVVVVILLRDF